MFGLGYSDLGTLCRVFIRYTRSSSRDGASIVVRKGRHEMGIVDAVCQVCGKAIRWDPATPRKCADHVHTPTAAEQAKDIVRKLGF